MNMWFYTLSSKWNQLNLENVVLIAKKMIFTRIVVQNAKNTFISQFEKKQLKSFRFFFTSKFLLSLFKSHLFSSVTFYFQTHNFQLSFLFISIKNRFYFAALDLPIAETFFCEFLSFCTILSNCLNHLKLFYSIKKIENLLPIKLFKMPINESNCQCFSML